MIIQCPREKKRTILNKRKISLRRSSNIGQILNPVKECLLNKLNYNQIKGGKKKEENRELTCKEGEKNSEESKEAEENKEAEGEDEPSKKEETAIKSKKLFPPKKFDISKFSKFSLP